MTSSDKSYLCQKKKGLPSFSKIEVVCDKSKILNSLSNCGGKKVGKHWCRKSNIIIVIYRYEINFLKCI